MLFLAKFESSVDVVVDDDMRDHRCDPAWRVWSSEWGYEEPDAKIFYALSAAGAAEKWAKWFDGRGDYSIIGGAAAVVHVQLVDVDRAEFLVLPTEVSVFEVYGESVPQYRAMPRAKPQEPAT